MEGFGQMPPQMAFRAFISGIGGMLLVFLLQEDFAFSKTPSSAPSLSSASFDQPFASSSTPSPSLLDSEPCCTKVTQWMRQYSANFVQANQKIASSVISPFSFENIEPFLNYVMQNKIIDKEPSFGILLAGFLVPFFMNDENGNFANSLTPFLKDMSFGRVVSFSLTVSGRDSAYMETVLKSFLRKGVSIESPLKNSPPLFTRMPQTLSDIHLLWGAFYASGDLVYLKRLLSVIQEKPSNNLIQQTIIQKFLKEKEVNPVVLAVLKDVVQQSPELDRFFGVLPQNKAPSSLSSDFPDRSSKKQEPVGILKPSPVVIKDALDDPIPALEPSSPVGYIKKTPSPVPISLPEGNGKQQVSPPQSPLIFMREQRSFAISKTPLLLKAKQPLSVSLSAIPALGEASRGLSVSYKLEIFDWEGKLIPSSTLNGVFIAGKNAPSADVTLVLGFEPQDPAGLYSVRVTLKTRSGREIPEWSQTQRVLLEKPF
jgi:hypothetical protein